MSADGYDPALDDDNGPWDDDGGPDDEAWDDEDVQGEIEDGACEDGSSPWGVVCVLPAGHDGPHESRLCDATCGTCRCRTWTTSEE